VSRKAPPIKTVSIEVNRLRGKRKGAILKDQVCYEDGHAVSYSLAYINLRLFPQDHGRVLEYDNSHGYHHRHFMGKVEALEYTSYEALATQFFEEVHELWTIEDAEDQS
jgi:hypothetical protein